MVMRNRFMYWVVLLNGVNDWSLVITGSIVEYLLRVEYYEECK